MKTDATIQIDPSFAYYLNRSEESVAAELELAGYRTVRYFVTDETRVNRRLVEALRTRGMTVWAMALGNGVYSTAHLPSEWPDWQMTLLKPINDGYFRFSPLSSRYVEWKKRTLAELVRTVPFSGAEIAEPYFPEWNGLSSGVYGDVGPLARAAFKRFSGSDMPDFRYPSSPRYYKRDAGRYLLWIEFRVQAVNRFLSELFNGPGGMREARPDLKVATWSIAVQGGGTCEQVRELQGIDAPEMIRAVRPHEHVIQTHWPDWMRRWLPPDYAKSYEPYVRRIRASHPDIPLGLQTDIGSTRGMRRSRSWLTRFAAASAAQGYDFWTAYEYHIGRYMYDEPPVPLKATRLDAQRISLQFNKRIDAETAGDLSRYRFLVSERPASVPDVTACVDGHEIVLTADAWPETDLGIELRGIRDTPALWLLKGEPAKTTPPGCRIRVPDRR